MVAGGGLVLDRAVENGHALGGRGVHGNAVDAGDRIQLLGRGQGLRGVRTLAAWDEVELLDCVHVALRRDR
jgi:hypothetical protein